MSGIRIPGALRGATLACLFAWAFVSNISFAEPAPASRVIGIEGDISIVLERGDYQPRPLDDRTPLILRIEKITPASGGAGSFTYDLHYIGLESGDYQLADYLMRPDGSVPTEIGNKMLQVRATLPALFDGALNPYNPRPFPWIGGYRMLLGLLAALWLGGIAAFIYFGRHKKVLATTAPSLPPPSYAERLRPLVAAAAAGTLGTNGQAELERLMTGYWREHLELPDQRMAEALAILKRHPEAGALLRALERWLHRPGGTPQEEIAGLLEPYRQAPMPPTPTREVPA